MRSLGFLLIAYQRPHTNTHQTSCKQRQTNEHLRSKQLSLHIYKYPFKHRIMKVLTSIFLSALAVMVASAESAGKKHDECPEYRCRQPCDPEPLAFEGLAPCEPVQRNGVVFLNRCFENKAVGTAYSQSVFENCNVRCHVLDPRKSEDRKFLECGYSVKPVCMSYDTYARPYCYDAWLQGKEPNLCDCNEKDECAGAQTALVGCGRFEVIQRTDYLQPQCFQECPEGYYPQCLLVRPLLKKVPEGCRLSGPVFGFSTDQEVILRN